MLWQGRKQSTNVDDRRGIGGGGMLVGGGVIGVIVLLINMFMGGNVDPSILQQLPTGGQSRELSAEEKAADDKRAEFVKVVLQDTEDVWNSIFAQGGEDYPEPTLVLFRDAVQSGCGQASSQSGPFYCPADQKVYIDLSFYQELQDRFNAPGDFAMAYVVAHEVGHHIQTVNGTSAKLARARGSVSETEYNSLSVKNELQADFLAGVWAHHAQKMKSILEEGDIEEALNAANAIGDDRLQRGSGRINPESFTHGTSAQRMYWFKKGFDTGDIRQGDTFNSPDL
ncbi:MAG: KPN_02809 family neutral zinc metallopeptidase [Flavitalea sp.]